MLRVISRPRTVPADRIALLNAGLFIILSSIPGSVARFETAVPSALASPCGGTYTGGGRFGSAGAGSRRREPRVQSLVGRLAVDGLAVLGL